MVNWDLYYPMLADLLVLAVDLRPHGRGNVAAHWGRMSNLSLDRFWL